MPVFKRRQVNPQSDNFKLLCFSHSELTMNFFKLLICNNDNFIRCEPCQIFFDQQEKLGFLITIVTVKNMSMVSVNDFDLFPAEPAIKETGDASDRSGF